MSCTILGKHISLIRPSKPKAQIILKSDLPRAKYNKRPKTRQLGAAEFFKLCLEYKDEKEGGKYYDF